MTSKTLLIASAVFLGGCASVVNDSTRPMEAETKTQAGERSS
jgi:uncharacterized protein YceK